MLKCVRLIKVNTYPTPPVFCQNVVYVAHISSYLPANKRCCTFFCTSHCTLNSWLEVWKMFAKDQECVYTHNKTGIYWSSGAGQPFVDLFFIHFYLWIRKLAMIILNNIQKVWRLICIKLCKLIKKNKLNAYMGNMSNIPPPRTAEGKARKQIGGGGGEFSEPRGRGNCPYFSFPKG